jgi:predicted PurR-regulated permease PerM
MPRPYRIALFTIAVVALGAVVVLASKPLLVLFGGLLFALVLRGLARPLARATELPYGACVAAVVATLVALSTAGVVSIGPAFRDQLVELTKTVPEAAHDVLDHLKRQPIGQAVGSPSADDTANRAMQSGAVFAVGTVLDVVAGLVVMFFVGVYGAAKPHDYSRVALLLAPERYRVRVSAILDDASTTLTRWLIGRLVSMLFVGITCGIAFSLLGVPLALTLAVVAGLLTFVEYIGAIVSAIPPLLLALTKGPTTALGVLVVFTVLHVIDGYVLTPLIARVSGRLAPAFTLSSQVVLGSLVGPLGVTFSTPLLIVAAASVRGWRRPATPTVETAPSSPALPAAGPRTA